jgi:hypothetical protein
MWVTDSYETAEHFARESGGKHVSSLSVKDEPLLIIATDVWSREMEELGQRLGLDDTADLLDLANAVCAAAEVDGWHIPRQYEVRQGGGSDTMLCTPGRHLAVDSSLGSCNIPNMSSTRVYRYGLLAPRENAELVRAQMRAAHVYGNRLVEIERARRAEQRAIVSTHGSTIDLERDAAAATARVELAVEAVAKAKSKDRSNKVPDELRVEIKAARAAKSAVVGQLREARRALREDEAVTARREEIDAAFAEQRRAARASCGVYWGSYLLVEAADDASRKMPLYDGAEPNDPRFARWENEGRIGVQIQKGMSEDELVDDTRLRVTQMPLPPGADPTSKRSAKRRMCELWMRVGSEGRDPIWARFPMVMHRPLPPGCRIRGAAVALRRIGPREEWSVAITVEFDVELRSVPAEGAVAIDLGWRQLDHGVRVGAWWDGERGGEVVVPWSVVSGLKKADELRATRDKNFDAARDALVAAKAASGSATGDTSSLAWPEWLVQATETLSQWRSSGRLAALALRWRSARFEGDEQVYAALEAWRYHDHHLWSWECSQRTKTLRRRREIYRVFAAKLATEYRTVVLEDFDLRAIARRKPIDAGGENESARSMRQAIAPSELRLCVRNAFAGRTVEVDAVDSTRECHSCGSIEKWDQAAQIRHTCSSCGVHWDQDDNAARVLLERASAGGALANTAAARNDESGNDSAPVRGGRFAKAKAAKRARVAEKEAARNQAAEPAE